METSPASAVFVHGALRSGSTMLRLMLGAHEDLHDPGEPDPKPIAQWRRKLSPREVGLVESKAGALMAARGYAPSGHPAHPPGMIESARLRLQDRWGRLDTAIRRFGAPLVLGEQVSRRLGLDAANRKARLRMQEITAHELK